MAAPEIHGPEIQDIKWIDFWLIRCGLLFQLAMFDQHAMLPELAVLTSGSSLRIGVWQDARNKACPYTPAPAVVENPNQDAVLFTIGKFPMPGTQLIVYCQAHLSISNPVPIPSLTAVQLQCDHH